jgi:hypothetical protein
MKPEPIATAHLVADGQWRALQGAAATLIQVRAEITARVQTAYAPQMARAGIFRRLWLKTRMSWEIRSEMKRECERLAPSNGLY